MYRRIETGNCHQMKVVGESCDGPINNNKYNQPPKSPKSIATRPFLNSLQPTFFPSARSFDTLCRWGIAPSIFLIFLNFVSCFLLDFGIGQEFIIPNARSLFFFFFFCFGCFFDPLLGQIRRVRVHVNVYSGLPLSFPLST